jgi:hypothetical protein
MQMPPRREGADMKRFVIIGLLTIASAPADAQEAFYLVERGVEASCEITPQPRPDDTVIGDPDGYPNFDEAEAALEELCDED